MCILGDESGLVDFLCSHVQFILKFLFLLISKFCYPKSFEYLCKISSICINSQE